ncbi:IS256 family transposase (plasmid) [Idiomarina loihiensis]|jgi:transposase-like protein|uniref:IS256 family transposase n=2 Tax=Idiomarinaceae TaxID=267893 RepID=UPI000E0EE57E|nr:MULTISPECIES: IS256 family transposase [Idiomarina]MRJ42206.1 IS256 family transposase [Idiomarina sp. FeN1]NCU57132.1 IS256 family transposase [Idiomarina sp. FenA--70]NCU59841.1 IS256 family transposase [Idiomarina sp. FenBw--71]TDO50988.1 transposase-like protein [Idiomarina sp. 017G]UUN13169.1 IS256 family transposase [Idiomarina loihiensis]|tara:strand:+ start:2595 stop:3800 length:1206 start_codon:yes stop_codon:yes gene_type:complete
MTKTNFDMDAALKQLREGKDLTGKDGILTPLIKQLTEAAMQAELEEHLSDKEQSNRKNGSTSKTVKSPAGSFELDTPRDRAGSFEPQLVKKHQTHLTDELERKIIALFSLGTSYQDIRMHIEDLYGIHVSNGTINTVTDKLLPELQAWRERPLEAVYPIVWLDAIHYKIKENGRFISKAVYTILGLNIDGKKELLGLYLSESEGAHHWLSVLTDLHNRGVQDILIACVDGLKGFPEAIESIYPKTEVQHCIIHQIRNSMKYVASKNQKAFMADLKCVYKAATLSAAESALDDLEAKWGDKYPIVIQSWRNKWATLSAYFKYPDYVRTVIYTTNAVEAVHRQFRKLTKTKGGFSNESSLLKLLYAGMLKATERWSHPVQNWNLTLSQLTIHFEGRLDGHIDL